MNIACPECNTIFRVDADRIPEAGVIARCRECGTAFRVDRDLGPTGPGQYVTAPRAALSEAGMEAGPEPQEPTSQAVPVPEAEATSPEPAAEEAAEQAPSEAEGQGAVGSTPVFGPQDPDTRARRLARALVSDIKVYHPDRWEESVQSGSLRSDFRDEIMKSWEEYVEQVGEEMAKRTPYFRDALNEILARGDRVF